VLGLGLVVDTHCKGLSLTALISHTDKEVISETFYQPNT